MKAFQIVDETGDVLKSVVGYTNAIKDEIVAIRDVVQSFLINISNKMSTILSTSVQKCEYNMKFNLPMLMTFGFYKWNSPLVH